MRKFKRFTMVLLALIILIGAVGFSSQPAQAASCWRIHVVSYGESLSWIGRWYGVNWVAIAQANGLRYPYTIYPWQRLCIPSGGGRGGYYPPPYYPPYNPPYYPYQPQYTTYGWSFQIIGVVKDNKVTIQAYNFPDNWPFKLAMRNTAGGSWVTISPSLDSGHGGNFKAEIPIPASLHGTPNMALRLVQEKKNGKVFTQSHNFSNIDWWAGSGGYYPGGGYKVHPVYFPGPYYWGNIPTIWIASVVRNSTVTFQTYNYPAGLDFQVLMGPMGTAGINGYYVGTFNSGSGGSMSVTMPVPPQLYNHYQISIRTQNLWSGYYSYNWFYNNTAYDP
jgi:LysM repeat protein